MVGFLTRFSIRNAAAVILLMLALIGGGIYSYQQLKLEEFPNVDIPYFTVGIAYPGATPEQSMKDIGLPLEKALSNIKGLKNLYDYASTGYDGITLEMNFDRSIDDVEKDVKEAISRVKLPEGALQPTYRKESPDVPYVYSFSVSNPNVSLDEVQQLVLDQIQPNLQNVASVDQVDINGTTNKSIYITIDPAKLKDHGMTLDTVKQALIANNLSAPVGNVTLSDKSMAVQAGQRFQSLDDIRNVNLIVVKQDMSNISNAFEGVHKGFDQVGSSMQTLGRSQGLMQGEIQVISALQQLSAALFSDQSKLSALEAQSKARPGSVSTQALSAATQAVKEDQTQIADLQRQLAGLQLQLKQISPSGAPETSSGAAARPQTAPSLQLSTVRLGDIASVNEQPIRNDPNQSLARTNGKPSVVVQVKPQPGTNVVQLVKDIKSKLNSIQLPPQYVLTELRDKSMQVKQSVEGMVREAGFGALFAVIVTLVFLRNLRATLVAIVSMPLSIFAAVIVLNYIGYSLNIMTLSGMAVAVGRVVDDSIVVIENIFRRIRASKEKDVTLVEEATREVGAAITSSTLTTVSVFLPMTMVPGLVGRFFAPFAWTVVIALVFSLLVSITAVPLVARMSLLKTKQHEEREGALQRQYRKLLSWSLGHKAIVAVISILLLAESGFAFAKLGINFLPTPAQKNYDIHIDMPVGSTLEATNHVTGKVESLIQTFRDNIEQYQTSVKAESGTVSFTLKDSVHNSSAVESDIRSSLNHVDGAKQITLTGTGSVAGSDQFFLVVNGPDLKTILKASNDMVKQLQTIPGLVDVTSSQQEAKPRVEVNVDNDKASRLGVNPAMVMGTVRSFLSGETVTSADLSGHSRDVVLITSSAPISSIEDIGNQVVTSMTGDEIPIHDLATVQVKQGPAMIQHLNQREYVSISGRITDPNSGAVTKKATDQLNALALPQGVTWTQQGAGQSMNEGFRNLAVAMVGSVVLVFVVMLVTFGEMTAPFAILFSLPFAIVGGFNGLWISHEPLGMPGMIGFLMLIGIIVTNAIVLMDRVEQQKRRGMTTREALLEAGGVRLRPILMTATATIAALIPLALSTGAGIISKTLAIVVIGGLTTSTLLTLIIVPVVYELLDRLRLRFY